MRPLFVELIDVAMMIDRCQLFCKHFGYVLLAANELELDVALFVLLFFIAALLC